MKIYTLTVEHFNTEGMTATELREAIAMNENSEEIKESIEETLSFSNIQEAKKVYNIFKKNFLKYSIFNLHLQTIKLRTDLTNKQLIMQIISKKGYCEWIKSIEEWTCKPSTNWTPIIEELSPETELLIEEHNRNNSVKECKFNPQSPNFGT